MNGTANYTGLPPPVRGCGSKHLRPPRLVPSKSRPLCGGVDRNNGLPVTPGVTAGRPLCGGVDRNFEADRPADTLTGRPLCGGVDRNRKTRAGPRWHHRRPLCGGVDRNVARAVNVADAGGRPLCGGVDRNFFPISSNVSNNCRPLCGGVDRNGQVFVGYLALKMPPPVRGCGSKRRGFRRDPSPRGAAPCAGVWIETAMASSAAAPRWPPPVRGCGSKPRILPCATAALTCRPLCGGVDRNCPKARAGGGHDAAPCAGVWIETAAPMRIGGRGAPPPVRGCGSKLSIPLGRHAPDRRPLCGGVDRNSMRAMRSSRLEAAPCAGVWIETSCR